jgi:hypothetical protein
MKIYAVQYYYDGSDTEDAFAEWFTTKTEAIARAKEINIDPENVIRGVTAYKSEVPTTNDVQHNTNGPTMERDWWRQDQAWR